MKILKRSILTIDIGEMRDLVILKPPIQSQSSSNGQIRVTYPPENWIEVFALVHPGGNVRALQEANLTYDDVITVYIRWQDTLLNNWKIQYNGYDYTIHKTSNVDAKKRFIQLLAYSKNP